MQEIEQLKRDLKSYGYYKKLKVEVEIQLYQLQQKIKRLQEPQSITYGEKSIATSTRESMIQIGSSNAERVQSLITTQLTLEKLKTEVDSELTKLDLDVGLAALSDEQKIIIERHYFEGVAFEFIGMQLHISKSAAIRANKKALWTIYKKSEKSVRGSLNSLL